MPTVEIDSTFYHTPSASAVRGWHAKTPPGAGEPGRKRRGFHLRSESAASDHAQRGVSGTTREYIRQTRKARTR